MKLHRHDEDGPPCRHMEGLLQQAADGSSKGFRRWYALSHAAKCSRCGKFLARLEETLGRLRGIKKEEPKPEVISRLAAGAWRNEE